MGKRKTPVGKKGGTRKSRVKDIVDEEVHFHFSSSPSNPLRDELVCELTPLQWETRNVKKFPCSSRQTRNGRTEKRDQPMSNISTADEFPQAQVSNFLAEPNQNSNDFNQRHKNSSLSSSINFTEIAALMSNDSSDSDEEPTVETGLVIVNGYKVKEEMASLLRSMFERYGDIVSQCTFESIYIRSRLLEGVCAIYQDLEKKTYMLITPVELKSVLAAICDLESTRVNVGWLRKRLDEISETLRVPKCYSTLKKAQESNRQAIERKKKDLKALQDELAGKETEDERLNETIRDTKAKMKVFLQQVSLVDGLL